MESCLFVAIVLIERMLGPGANISPTMNGKSFTPGGECEITISATTSYTRGFIANGHAYVILLSITYMISLLTTNIGIAVQSPGVGKTVLSMTTIRTLTMLTLVLVDALLLLRIAL
jgi:hypothetical protein